MDERQRSDAEIPTLRKRVPILGLCRNQDSKGLGIQPLGSRPVQSQSKTLERSDLEAAGAIRGLFEAVA